MKIWGTFLVVALIAPFARADDEKTSPPAPQATAPVKAHSTNVVEEIPTDDWPKLSLSLSETLVETNRTGLVFGRKPSGIITDAAASKKPLDFINPKAPPEAGNGEAYVSRDPISNRPMGLKLFSFNFQCFRGK